jgi:hypothetical protein
MLKTILLLVIVAALAGGIYSWYSGKLTGSATTATTTPEQLVDEEEPKVPLTGTGTLADLQSLGTNLECRIWRDDPRSTMTLEGSTFLSGSKIRGNYVSQSDGMAVTSSMIMTSDHLYVWSVIDGETYGVEKSLVVDSGAPMLDAREPVPMNATIRYDCTPWASVDAGIFTPPSDILFRDLETVMEGGQEYGTAFEGADEGQDMCLLCERVDGSSERKACRSQFKCGD